MSDPHIVIVFDHHNLQEFLNLDLYQRGYSQLADRLFERGVRAFVTSGSDSYRGENRLAVSYEFDGAAFVPTQREVSADLIFRRGDIQLPTEARTFNPIALEELVFDKWATYQRFDQFMARSWLVHDQAEFRDLLAKLELSRIVVKPIQGLGGTGVRIGAPDELLREDLEFPFVLQEFLDSSAGIPGVTAGLHDLRVIMLNGIHVLSLLRIPAEGSFISNINRGGTSRAVPLSEVSPEAFSICDAIDEELAREYPQRLYSADLCRLPDGSWKIFELNPWPGLGPRERNGYHVYHDLLIEAMIAALGHTSSLQS